MLISCIIQTNFLWISDCDVQLKLVSTLFLLQLLKLISIQLEIRIYINTVLDEWNWRVLFEYLLHGLGDNAGFEYGIRDMCGVASRCGRTNNLSPALTGGVGECQLYSGL